MDYIQQALLIHEITEAVERYLATVDLILNENDALVEISRQQVSNSIENLARWRVQRIGALNLPWAAPSRVKIGATPQARS